MWRNNTYYNTTTQTRFGVVGPGSQTFTNWKSLTGFDASSTAIGSALPDQAIVRPNGYEAGRANIIIYAASGATSINVNLSNTGLSNGQTYRIKNAFNWNGSNVATGTYNTSNPIVSVPLNAFAKSVATPLGRSLTPPSTCPNLCLMVVIPN